MRSLTDDFHIFYETTRVWEKNFWLGIPCWRLPFDMMVQQELIFNIKPDYIIETGTGLGGGASFFASVCELIDHGQVITIDLTHRYNSDLIPKKIRDRIIFVGGGSTNPLVFQEVESLTKGKKNMVFLDSWHVKDYVLEEMNLYGPLVSIDSYMVVEDTHAGKTGHPVEWKWDNDGSYEAVEEFLKTHGEFEIDYECEKHCLTFHPKGWLRRIK